MDTIKLTATPRQPGKKAVKAVRREDRVPCVLYGPHQAPVHFAVDRLALRPLIHTSETHRVVVRLDGDEYEAIVKAVAFHPVTDVPLHVDFQALTKGEKLTVTVPIHIEGSAPGVRAGGVLAQPLHEIEVRCVPADIPGHVSVDVSGLEMGDALHVADLQLGDRVEVLTDGGLTVVTVTAPRVAVEEEVEAVEGEALPAEGEEETGEAGPAPEEE
ncbi:MAG TPA: 50S ribosomal protein L25 [Rubricoccaceae bacterium]|jgi:large subunit ribosomal protein L25|nr:50S ribosomal protein L25 [Rubricoccaceae bacterium]